MVAPPAPPLEAKILVVDDERGVRDFLNTLLGKQGYEIVLRENAQTILDDLKDVEPDLLLIDVMMPGKDGFTALKELREVYREEDLPVIMLTALDSREDAIRGFRLGASDYLTKPPKLRELLERVDTQLRMHAKSDDTMLGHYRLHECIGTGGMAYVYRAEDTELGMDVALKVVRREFADDPGFLERLEREAEHVSRVMHDNVIRFMGLEKLDQTMAIVLEFLEGRTLHDLYVSPAQAARLGAGAARGLAAIHAAGLVHRDIKPDNIFLTNAGVVKIFDLGIASATEEERLTQHGHVAGTPSYMSPERMRGDITAAADAYALGCVLYELTTGAPAFAYDMPLDDLWAAKRKSPPRISERVVVDPELDQLVADLMHEKPKKRPNDLDDVADRLETMAERLFAEEPAIEL